MICVVQCCLSVHSIFSMKYLEFLSNCIVNTACPSLVMSLGGKKLQQSFSGILNP